MRKHRAIVLGALAALLVAMTAITSTPVAAADTDPSVTSTVKVVAPDAAATNFGRAFSTDGDRLAVAAKLNGAPVLYVFDRSEDSWSHSATIHPPAGSSPNWGIAIAVSGNTLAVTDSTNPNGDLYDGIVRLYHLSAGTWSQFQRFTKPLGDPNDFGDSVWLTGSGLIIRSRGFFNEIATGAGRWFLYQRGSNGLFAQIFDSSSTGRSALDMSVGTYNGQFVIGNPGQTNPEDAQAVFDNKLMVWNMNTTPATVTLDETTPYSAHAGWYRNVDISNGVIAYQNGFYPQSQLHILKPAGNGWVPDTDFALTGGAIWISVVPGVVLVGDTSRPSWRTFVQHGAAWAAGDDISPPNTGGSTQLPVAGGSRLAIGGTNSVSILTVSPAPK